MDMSGYYTCIAKNELGTDTTRAGLTVNSKSSNNTAKVPQFVQGSLHGVDASPPQVGKWLLDTIVKVP